MMTTRAPQGHSTEGFWDVGALSLRVGWGWTYSQAGTATVSLHGERKWALEKGGGRVRAPKLISCRSQTQPQVRDNMCVCACVFGCVCLRGIGGKVRESSVNSEGHTMAEGERERQRRRGADLHQRVWICM